MRFKCWNCGEIFDEDEVSVRTEYEECWGARVPLFYNCCPSCGEDICEEDQYIEEEDDEE